MASLSFLEKLGILFEVSKSSVLFIVALIFILFFGLILFTTTTKNAKSSRRFFLALYAFIIVAIFVIYRESIINMYNYLANNLFVIIYFPNLAVYFAALLITNIILWISVFNFKSTKVIKNINISVFLIMNYLLVALLTVISKHKLDVFDQTSIYGNQTARAIIELSSTLFITWIIFLVLYKFIYTYITRNNVTTRTKIKVVKKIVEKEKPATLIIKRTLPKSVVKTNAPKVVSVRQETHTEPVITKSEPIVGFDNLLTLEDYKLLLGMLKEKRQKEKEEAIKKEVKEKEENKFRELQGLYSVR